MPDTPQTLDQAIANAKTLETTLTVDQSNLASLQASAATAAAPVPAAEALVSSDVDAFNAGMDSLSAAALAAKIPTQATTS